MINWVERLNYALAYIDNYLCDEIDFDEISRITACPIETLQRFFVLNTGITLTEYIRRRKLHEAFNELKITDNKVIDIAIKYGYDSPDAFSVAFKRIYGVSPSTARSDKNIMAQPFLRMIFFLSINYIQEDKIMKKENSETTALRNPGSNWYSYFYDETCGWSWSTAYISNLKSGGDGKRLTLMINHAFKDKYLGANIDEIYGGGISVNTGHPTAYGIEIYTPVHTKIKTHDTVRIDQYGNIIIGGDTIFNIVGTLIQAGNAKYMISSSEIVKDETGSIVPDEIISAEIEKFGSLEFDADDYNKRQAIWAKWPWYSKSGDESKTLYIKNGTKIIAKGRNHNSDFGGIFRGESSCAGTITLNDNKSCGNGQIELPNGTILNVPRKTSVSVEYESGECTITIGDDNATIIKPDGAEITISAGTIIDNEGNIIK